MVLIVLLGLLLLCLFIGFDVLLLCFIESVLDVFLIL